MKLGVGRFESVSILNSPEWLLSNNGAIAAGGFAAGIYTTNEPPACKYIVDHCNARVIVVEGQKQLDKILAIRAELPKLAAIVVYGGDFDKSANDGVGPGTAKVYGWKEFMTLGESVSDAELQPTDDQKPGHCCTLIYTSGTTGNPKAVMISHDNVTWTTRANLDHQPAITSGPLRVVSYLPLSHIAAQVVDIHSPMGGLLMGLPAEVHFARPDALKGSLKQTLIAARPTVFFAVPRVWEKFAEALQAVGKKTTGSRRPSPPGPRARAARSRRVPVQVQEVAPLDGLPRQEDPHQGQGSHRPRLRAPLHLRRRAHLQADPRLLRYPQHPHRRGVRHVREHRPADVRHEQEVHRGHLRPVIPGAEIKIDLAKGDKPGNGEVCFRGRHVMMGYMHNQAKTNETIDEDGWLSPATSA